MTYLLLLVYFFIVLIIIARIVIRSKKTIKRKIIATLAVLFLSIIPIWWDEILGRMYFSYVCNKEAGTKIFKTHNLDVSYWNKDGKPMFIESGLLDEEVLGNRFVVKKDSDKSFSKIFNITKFETSLIDLYGNVELGKVTKFIYFGGWIVKYSGFHNVGDVCPDDYGVVEPMLNKIFIKNN